MWLPESSVAYDFAAADTLESTLNQASAKLINLNSQRVTWAWDYLRYQTVNGQQQGWAGTEYDKWARQFNQSLRSIYGFIQNLAEQAFTIHNQSYNAAVSQGPTQRTRMLRPASAPPPGKAPPNSDPSDLNTQSATPDLLYKYSDLATGLNDQIRPFFANTLAPLLDGQSTPAGNANSGLAQAIVWFLRYQLLELDARVRIVGQAFELADSGSGRSLRTFQTPRQLDGAIANQVQQAQKASQLVQYFDKHGATSTFWNQLKLNASNPAFMAAFFSGLAPGQAETLLETYGDWQGPEPPNGGPDESGLLAQALASAYQGGMAPATEKQIVQWLDLMPVKRFRPLFYTALSVNPQAALHFVQTLTPNDIRKLASVNGAGERWQSQFIDVYAAAIKAAPDETAAQGMFDDITKAVTSAVTWDPYTSDGSAIGDLIAAMAYWKIPDPPAGANQSDLEGWTIQMCTDLKQLITPWMNWIRTSEASNDLTKSQVQGFTSIVTNKILGWFFGALQLAGDGYNWLQGQAGTDITTGITDFVASTEDAQQSQQGMLDLVKPIAERIAITKLLAEGAIYPGAPGNEGSQPVANTPQNVNAIMQAFNTDFSTQYSIHAPGGDILTWNFLSGVNTEAEKKRI